MALDTRELTAPAGPPSARVQWWRRPWIAPLALIVVAYLIFQIRPYVPESTAPLPDHQGFPLYYPLLVVHMIGGTLAMLTVILQVWPRIRVHHPTVHRISGRVYVVSALVSAVIGLIIVRFAPPVGQIGVVCATLLWFAFTLTGFVWARRRDWERHRRFMLYSFAIVMNNVWGVLIVNTIFAFGIQIDFNYLLEGARWIGWVANLMIVQWWLYRTAGRPLGLPARRR
ncbi:DUF2306 domain-containing protein [Planobispora longispora]|uniref:DUF2306 domain-containing protein n=1 Tax=Planobispora longispora TaxID=28887 RepID=A0A8J3W541_9ACTN|nr:DUF2306 domain-containing protein [Planobispora longispora]BFE84776.1 DUF2306 domain-containing protein [Planobispora longispora]GIH75466.1 hypothetical protein Plo01_18950 [Planobispora longispora]